MNKRSLSRNNHRSRQFYLLLTGLVVFFVVFHHAGAYLLSNGVVQFHLDPDTFPLYGNLDVQFEFVVFLPITVFSILLISYTRKKDLLLDLSPVVIIVLFMIAKGTVDLSIARINGSIIPEWYQIHQYIDDVDRFAGFGDLLGSYTAMSHRLTPHSSTHPPGPVMVLRFAGFIFGYTWKTKWLVGFGASVLTIIPLYLLGSAIFDKKTVLNGLLLYLFLPSVVLYSVISMDILFALLMMLTLWAFVRGAQTAKFLFWGTATGLLIAACGLLTFASSFVPLYMIVFFLVHHWFTTDPSRDLLRLILVAGLVSSLVYLFLWVAFDFNIVSCLVKAIHNETIGKPVSGTGTFSRYLLESTVNLSGLVFGMGLPVNALFIMRLQHIFTQDSSNTGEKIFVVSFCIVVILLSFSTLYRGETERIWMFMAPFVVFPAARVLKDTGGRSVLGSVFGPAVVLLFLQTLLYEMLINTGW